MKTTLDRHDPRLIPNHCHIPDPPHFLLLSSFKGAKYGGGPYGSWIFLFIFPFLMMLLHASKKYIDEPGDFR
jgi:hypothetical protein